ncbi:MAG: hypothetical protein AAB611_02865 [Patescibacteria group bacterium]
MSRNDKQFLTCILITAFFLVASMFAYNWLWVQKHSVGSYVAEEEFQPDAKPLKLSDLQGKYVLRYEIRYGEKVPATPTRFLEFNVDHTLRQEVWRAEKPYGLYSYDGIP